MLTISNLRIEYQKNPLGMDELSPRFSYELTGGSARQSACRICVVSESGEEVWDSGFVASGESLQISYKGKTFNPFTRYDWKVQVKDENGVESNWSQEEAFFETGFLGADWEAAWIHFHTGMENQRSTTRFAQEFKVEPKKIRKARLYASALGLYEAYVNGTKVSDDCFLPGWTDYHVRVQYQAFDVGPMLEGQASALISAELGEGWYAGRISRFFSKGKATYGECPMFIAELHVFYEDGTKSVFKTDSVWTFSYDTPVRMSDIYMGETYEAWREDDDRAWASKLLPCNNVYAEKCSSVAAKLVWHSGAAIRRMAELKPVSIVKRPSGSYLVDFGQNFAGRERIRLENTQKGSVIVIRHGEILEPDGSIYTKTLRSAAATTLYSTGTNAVEVYEPRFTYYGFRYLEISGWPGELTEEMISAQVIHSDMEVTGKFECSNPLLNRLFENIVWSQRSSCLDVPCDGPSRDERLGWTGDWQMFANSATYLMDCSAFLTKYIEDLNTCMRGDFYPSYAPDPYYKLGVGFKGSTGWSEAGLVCPWQMFRKYGDLRLARKYFHNISRWLDAQIRRSGGSLIVDYAVHGDHLQVNAETDHKLLSTAYLAESNKLLAKVAGLLGYNDEAAKREALFEAVKEAYGKAFFSPAGDLLEKTQTAAVLSLHFGLTPANARQKTIDFLVTDILETRGGHFSCGLIGLPFLLETLSEAKRQDIAYKLLEQTTFPSWIYPVTQGATTMWEHYDSWTEENGFCKDVQMNSFNHYWTGVAVSWLFEGVCGIVPCSDSQTTRAFKRFKLAPLPGGSLTDAKAIFKSPYGPIRSSWKLIEGGNRMAWEFEVPCNAEAEIVFPTSKPVPSLASASGISVGADGNVLAGPGTYKFEFEL